MPTWTRHLYEHNTLAVSKGESNGYETVYKFGYNPDINGAEETVWEVGGNTPWPDTAFVAYVVSNNAADANGGTGANKVRIEGLDADYNLKSVEVELNGVTPVQITGTWIRIHRAFVTLAGSGGTTAGTVTVQNVGATVTYASFTNDNQTQMAVYTVPAGYTFYIDDVTFSTSLTLSNKFATISFAQRDFGTNVFRKRLIAPMQSSQFIAKFVYPFKVEEKADMECRAYTDAVNNTISASFQGVLIKNDPTGNV